MKDQQYEDKLALIAQMLGMAAISAEELADQFIHAREAVERLAEATRTYFAFKNSGRGGSRMPIDRELTAALWEVDKYLGESTKLADKAERARRNAIKQ